ncbi:MAG: glycosyl hydrolase [Chitinophagaceae bacterium]
MQKKIASVLIACTMLGHVNAQVKWPAITQTMKPWTRWWWQGSAVDKPGLTAAMQQYQQAGLGGMEITPIYGIMGEESKFINFLSPKWVDMLQYTLQEAKRLNLGIDMATGTGWPFGGPWVTQEDACKYVTYKTYSLKGGETLKDSIAFQQEAFVRTANGKPLTIQQVAYPVTANKDLQALSLDQVRYPLWLPLVLMMAYDEKGNAVNITDKVAAGKLNWTAPAGSNWTLYALFQGWHGKQVERAAPGGEGDVIDHFNSKAVNNYLSHFDKAFEGKDISYLRCFFNDSYEVDDARGQSNWTPDFFEQFQKRRGYDLRPELPALFQKENDEKHLRLLWDYRQTISELLLEKFTEPWDAWAKAKGKMIRNQSHGSPANILDLYGAIDIPETEGMDVLRFKFATSTAHVMGKPLASSESATWLNEHFLSSLGDVKLIIDKYFIGGVNHIFYHGTNYSPPNETWPGWLFYAAVHFHPNNPFWKDFGTLNSYIARCQSFLQNGRPDNDILVYFPFNDRISEPGRDMLHHFDGMEGFDKTTFKTSSEYLLEKGYAFDFISDKQLLDVKAIGGALRSAGGSYQTILLPEAKFMTVETMQQLIQLANNGATIAVYKELPKDVPGYGNLSQRRAAYQELLKNLSFQTINGVQKAVVGKGAFLLGDDLTALLAAAKVQPEAMNEMGLHTIRRKYNNGRYYFISNSSQQRVDGWVPVKNATGGTVVLFDPMFAKSGLARTRKAADGTTQVYLQLNPGESCVLQLSNTAVTGNKFLYPRATGASQPVNTTWDLTFVSGGPTLPAARKVTSLGSWTNGADEDVKNFSGTARYTTRIAKPAGTGEAYMLDLGNVGESAEVILNGKKIATLIGPVYQVVIPAGDWKADNELQVVVTNGMANRIADLDRRGVQWKKFYNINFPSRLPANRGADGLFTAAKWDPKASGLLSTVSITPVTYQQPEGFKVKQGEKK